MKQVLVEKGKVIVEEVPSPLVGEGEVLVQVYYSCISSGTERALIDTLKRPLYQKALNDPAKIKKLLLGLRKDGFRQTVARLKEKVESSSPLGYSASGRIIEAGSKVNDFGVGKRVGCVGAGVAHHAEFVAVPRNLLVSIPDEVSLEWASTVALGSIALQGVRRAAPMLGEYVAVMGLGPLGQLVSQILKAQGCRVIGIDVDQRRVNLASSLGIERGVNAQREDLIDEVIRTSGGWGVDCAIITASLEGNDIVDQAIALCRKKGRIVIIGSGDISFKREECYKKEQDILMSTSYGPGRYDEQYERGGTHYPYAYVRWTETRNMQEYMRLLKEKKVTLNPLIERIYPVEEAVNAYASLHNKVDKAPLMVLLQYNKESVPQKAVIIASTKVSTKTINVALIGAGSFSKTVLLSYLQRLKPLYSLYAIMSRKGSNAKAVAKHYGAFYATTDLKKVLGDVNVDMVAIATRHNLHASLAQEAAQAKKAVFLEKPMALNKNELQNLTDVLTQTKVPFMVNFNRRFSPSIQKIKTLVKDRTSPLMITYRMNAGFLPSQHWVHQEEGGGRNIGEACHIYDLFNFFTESTVAKVTASALEPKTEQYQRDDNFVATIQYKDGSVAVLTYTALGSKDLSKERMEVYWDGKIVVLDDYRKLSVFGVKTKRVKQAQVPQKGYLQALRTFARSMRSGDGYPIPLWQLVQATEISFQVQEQLLNRG